MFDTLKYWNPRQTSLRQALKEKNLDVAKDILYDLHSCVHSSEVYKGKQSFFDEIWNGLSEKAFSTMPSSKDVTIAWDIWHITRIEDLTVNILIADKEQILNDQLLQKLNSNIRDTGNAMTKEEIASFSNSLNFNELRNYRNSVGIRTKEVLENLGKEDLKRKFSKPQLDRILTEGGVTEHPDSIWLLDFWGRKNVSGILLMPVTRHQIVHLNDCCKLKIKCSNYK